MPESKHSFFREVFPNGASKVMGYIQENEIEKGRQEKLVDGKLQFWQFLDFKGEKHMEFYRAQQFNDEILSKFDSPSVAQHGLAGYQALIAGTINQ